MLAQSQMQWQVGSRAALLELLVPFLMASMLLPMASLEVAKIFLYLELSKTIDFKLEYGFTGCDKDVSNLNSLEKFSINLS